MVLSELSLVIFSVRRWLSAKPPNSGAAEDFFDWCIRNIKLVPWLANAMPRARWNVAMPC